MIKRILIPLDPSPYTETATKIGCAVARQQGAELTGLVVLDIPGIEKSIGMVPLGGLYYAERLEKQKEREARDRIQSLLSRFKETCEKAGVAHREAELQGSPSERILGESMFYDAVIVGLRTFYQFETSDSPGDSLEEILDHAITPVYGVPERFSLPVVPEEKIKVLIPFDGSLPSARALHRFAQLAVPDAMEVVLLMSDPDREKADSYLDRAEAYLKAHAVSDVKKEWTSQEIIQAVDDHYLDWATMVVVGAHAKAGLFDFMVGSLTRYLIEKAEKPVLIGQ